MLVLGQIYQDVGIGENILGCWYWGKYIRMLVLGEIYWDVGIWENILGC